MGRASPYFKQILIFYIYIENLTIYEEIWAYPSEHAVFAKILPFARFHI